ncbi:VPLPA-CTERM sorting domain-containing protein [uncultured Jannaschia sp.]|uniref:VPLPA-CTERM sorting domain-containing protein n=1 Tax=uncultured Jannaschia sp. TaxID=293347 RepID=UPI002618D4B2|nr:VPLPA-CTERM sorting domain-containing protein [uncultured Jannaschia sp.]
MLRSILFATTASLGLAGAADAATHTFSLADDGSTSQVERTFTYGDLSLTVTGAIFGYDAKTGKAAFTPIATQSHDKGIGIQNSLLDNTHLVDGSGKQEALVFTFNREVRLDNISFSYWDGNDHFALATGANVDFKGISGSGSSFYHTEGFSKDYTSDIFALGAFEKNDEYKVKKLTVSYDDTPPPSPVPLPAAAWMLVAGIGGLAAAARRKG